MRCVLQVESTTNNVIAVGVCGQMQVFIVISMLFKQTLSQMQKMWNKCITNWTDYANVRWNIGHQSTGYCKITVSNCYKHSWLLDVTKLNRNPIYRTSCVMFKTEYRFEKYLVAIVDCRYRTAMTKLRGRFTKPKIDIRECLSPLCSAVKDEIHFPVNCKLHEAERSRFFGKLTTKI